VLSKLERAMPKVSVSLAGGRQYPATGSGDDSYGETEYIYGNQSDISRSTSPREILPLIYGLAGVSQPSPRPGIEYPGYPLVASASATFLWFFAALPLLIASCWWWSRRPSRLDRYLMHEGGSS
jgi:ABC-2 type transport system permease protein